jgi:chemotaxis protein CheX
MSAQQSLTLPPVLDLSAAAALAGELRALRGQPLSLDASRVERLGGLCLQVLISARNSWRADGLAFTVGQRSPTFEEALALSGAGELA